MLNRFACIVIAIACAGYAVTARGVLPNEDERASLVIVLGKFPPRLSPNGAAMTKSEYQNAVDYKKYSYQGIDFPKTVQSVVNDNGNALLYYLLLACWTKIFGLHMFWLRALTILIAGLNLCILYRLAENLGLSGPYRICLIIHTALNPVFFGDAILIRGYMLALTGCLIAAWYLREILSSSDSKPVHYLLYFSGMLLALGCHYYTVCFFIVQLLPMGRKAWLLKQGRPAWLAGYGAAALACLAWIWRLYPDGLKNIAYFYDTAPPSVSSGYQISVFNYLKQYGYYASNVLGVISATAFSKTVLKILAACLLLVVACHLFKNRKRSEIRFLFFLTVSAFALYSIQSVVVRSFTNFKAHYLVIFVPFWILGLYFFIADGLATRFGFSPNRQDIG